MRLAGPEITLSEKQIEAVDLIASKLPYVKFWGSSRSGKTFAISIAIIIRALVFKGSKHLVARYDKTRVKKTVWRQEFLPHLVPLEKAGMCKLNRAEGYVEFTNGSYIQIGGLRPNEIDSVLSSEFETIYVSEANENSWAVIEQLMTRLNGKSQNDKGQTIRTKFLIDLNPTHERHWSNQAWIHGVNPETAERIANHDQYCNLHFRTEDNKENLSSGYIDRLKAMGRTRRLRFYDGKYGSTEGLIYQLPDKQIIDDIDVSNMTKILAIDFGFSKGHAFVCLWIATDDSENIYVYKEYVVEGQTVTTHAQTINDILRQNNNTVDDFDSIVCDHDAAERMTLEQNGLPNEKAFKKVEAGIDNVLDKLERGKLFITRDCPETISEFFAYRWKDGVDRVPVKEYDNCMDSMRYGINKLYPIDGSVGAVVGSLPW